MRRGMVTLSVLVSAVSACGQDAPPPFPREARGVWVATVANIDWPSSRSLTVSQMQTEARAILDRAVAARLNFVVFQVRSECDAMYASRIEPWSRFLTGDQNVAPSGGFDPLRFWIDEAHARGLELHAWFNPYRAASSTPANYSTIFSPQHVGRARTDLVVDYDGDKWLDPGKGEVRARTTSVILDVVNRYEIDGVHIDDYFYPYPAPGVPFPDSATYAAYQQGGGTLSLADWRRDNVNQLVQQIHRSIKIRKPWIKFGISPFGIWRPGNPSGIVGLDAYASLYADSRLWFRNGWLDYLSPQLYWRIAPAGQSYPVLLAWWRDQNVFGRHLWPGNYTSQVRTDFGNWPVQEIVDQIGVTRETPGATGNLHFSARTFSDATVNKSLRSTLAAGPYSVPSLVPASTWLDGIRPAAPEVGDPTLVIGGYRVTWQNRATEPIRRFAVYARYGVNWRFFIAGKAATEYTVPSADGGQPLAAIAVSAVDRVNNESDRTVRTVGSGVRRPVLPPDFVCRFFY